MPTKHLHSPRLVIAVILALAVVVPGRESVAQEEILPVSPFTLTAFGDYEVPLDPDVVLIPESDSRLVHPMIAVEVMLIAQGETFSPRKAGAELGVDFSHRGNEPGALGATGKYKGQPIPFGTTILNVPLTPEERQSHEPGGVADLLPPGLSLFRNAEVVPTLRRYGATEIRLLVNVAYRGQCNLELSPELLAALAGLGVPVLISCFVSEEDDG